MSPVCLQATTRGGTRAVAPGSCRPCATSWTNSASSWRSCRSWPGSTTWWPPALSPGLRTRVSARRSKYPAWSPCWRKSSTSTDGGCWARLMGRGYTETLKDFALKADWLGLVDLTFDCTNILKCSTPDRCLKVLSSGCKWRDFVQQPEEHHLTEDIMSPKLSCIS